MKKHPFRTLLFRIITVVMIAAIVCCALYIMIHHIGLSPQLDFGAGAYYYADIPNYDKYIPSQSYPSSLPYWVYVLLFLAWGWIMYRLLAWIEQRNNSKKHNHHHDSNT